jgi:hypothetical protein
MMVFDDLLKILTNFFVKTNQLITQIFEYLKIYSSSFNVSFINIYSNKNNNSSHFHYQKLYSIIKTIYFIYNNI